MSYFNVWKKKQTMCGRSDSEDRVSDSKRNIDEEFKNDPSYKEGLLTDLNLKSIYLDFKMINIDKTTDKKKMYLRPDTRIDVGSYIKCCNDVYMVDEFESNLLSPRANVILCNQAIMIDKDTEPQYGIIEGESYGVKITSSNDILSSADVKVKFTLPNNEVSRRIPLDFRYIIGNSEFGIYKVKDITVYKKNRLLFTCEKDKLKPEDDLKNNIAFNPKNGEVNPPQPIDYEILGEENIKLNKEYSYLIEPITDVEWMLDDDTLASIVSFTNNSCIIKGLKGNQMVILSAFKDGKLIKEKDIFISR